MKVQISSNNIPSNESILRNDMLTVFNYQITSSTVIANNEANHTLNDFNSNGTHIE